MFHKVIDDEVEHLEISLISERDKINVSVDLRYQEGFSQDIREEHLNVFVGSVNVEGDFDKKRMMNSIFIVDILKTIIEITRLVIHLFRISSLIMRIKHCNFITMLFV